MLFCSTLEGTCTGDAIFIELDSKLREMGLPWDQCVGVCTDEAGAMLVKRKGLRGKIMQVAPNSRPLNARLFAMLCKDMGSDYEALLLHTEARWLSRGKVLTRLYQVRDEVRLFLLECGSTLNVHLCDSIWLAKHAYMKK
ncbi:zinc finger BED domain-containing protein 5-like [Oratosquilla oratoria]|uniref:zinc finger BED domain-containing protein 5-like n=1 Tax=Oratosquilla oratoria TaxID=337810 RepID=UPI003F776C90